MDTKTSRITFYVTLELLNLIVIWLLAPLAALTPVVFWALIVASLTVDQFVLAWSAAVLVETNQINELTVSGVWAAEQVTEIAILTVLAIIHSGFLIGLLIAFILAGWTYYRGSFLGKLLDIRYW